MGKDIKPRYESDYDPKIDKYQYQGLFDFERLHDVTELLETNQRNIEDMAARYKQKH